VLLAIAAVTLCYLRTCLKKNTKIDAAKIKSEVVNQSDSTLEKTQIKPAVAKFNHHLNIDTAGVKQFTLKVKGLDDDVMRSVVANRLTPQLSARNSTRGSSRCHSANSCSKDSARLSSSMSQRSSSRGLAFKVDDQDDQNKKEIQKK